MIRKRTDLDYLNIRNWDNAKRSRIPALSWWRYRHTATSALLFGNMLSYNAGRERMNLITYALAWVALMTAASAIHLYWRSWQKGTTETTIHFDERAPKL